MNKSSWSDINWDKNLFIFVHMSQWEDMIERFDTDMSPSWTIASLLDVWQQFVMSRPDLVWKVEFLWVDESRSADSKDVIKQKINEYSWRVTVLFSELLYNSKNTIKFASELKKTYKDRVNIIVWGQLTRNSSVKKSLKDKKIIWTKIFDVVTEWDWEIIIPMIIEDVLSGKLETEYIKYLWKDSKKFNFSSFEDYYWIEWWIRERKAAWKNVQLTMQWLGWPWCSWAKFKWKPCSYCALQNITTERSLYSKTELEHLFANIFFRYSNWHKWDKIESLEYVEWKSNMWFAAEEFWKIYNLLDWLFNSTTDTLKLNTKSQKIIDLILKTKNRCVEIVDSDTVKIIFQLYIEKMLQRRFALDENDTIFDVWNNFIPIYNEWWSFEEIIRWLEYYKKVRNELKIKIKKYIYLRADYFESTWKVASLLKDIWVKEVYLWIEHFDLDMLAKMNKWDYDIDLKGKWDKFYWRITNALSQLESNGIDFRIWLVLWHEWENRDSLEILKRWINWAVSKHSSNLQEIWVFPIEIIPWSQVWSKFRWITKICEISTLRQKINRNDYRDEDIIKLKSKADRIFGFFEKNWYLTRRQQIILQKCYIELMTEVWYESVINFTKDMKQRFPDKVYWVDIELTK